MKRQAQAGVYAGLVGGAVFGALMGMMGMLPMVAGLVGSSSALVGLAVHLVVSAIIGVGFALTVGSIVRTTAGTTLSGVGYGLLWWFLGPVTLMPLMLGMGLGARWSAAGLGQALPSLLGHLIYGFALGVTYVRLTCGRTQRPAADLLHHHA
jgi:uncharacterized membrane protein YagU involved in acid resistance